MSIPWHRGACLGGCTLRCARFWKSLPWRKDMTFNASRIRCVTDVVSCGEAGQRLIRCHQHCGSATDQYIDRVVYSPVVRGSWRRKRSGGLKSSMSLRRIVSNLFSAASHFSKSCTTARRYSGARWSRSARSGRVLGWHADLRQDADEQIWNPTRHVTSQ